MLRSQQKAKRRSEPAARLICAVALAVLAPGTASASEAATRGMSLLPIVASPEPAAATRPGSGPVGECETWAIVAAGQHGVPVSLLRAILLAETGRTLRGVYASWPWTVNANGKGTWFDNRAEAAAFARSRVRVVGAGLDIGCFQLNTRWHGRAFSGVDQMFDPAANADYAARFLLALYREFGSWRAAAAAFHSRTPERGADYLSRVESILAAEGLSTNWAMLPAATAQPAAGPASLGSLFPLSHASGGSALLSLTTEPHQP